MVYLEIPSYLKTCTEPCLFKGALFKVQWDIDKLTAEAISNYCFNEYTFHLGHKSSQGIIWEGDCTTVTSNLKTFLAWARGPEPKVKYVRTDSSQKALTNYNPEEYWGYFAYKYMKELDLKGSVGGQILDAVRWQDFGFPGLNGNESTLWIGTKGAVTQCHQDAYGCNLVAQIEGKKKWTLFPPCETPNLKPTRIPYEESTIYAGVDVRKIGPNVKRVEVTLGPGDVLFVPPRYTSINFARELLKIFSNQ